MNQQPNSRIPKSITQGQNFIIVGMGYLKKGPSSGTGDVPAQVSNIKTVLKYVHKHTSIDTKSITLMGWSKGGWSGSAYAEASASIWRGMVLMGSGRTGRGAPTGFRGKPVFIGIGEKDDSKKRAMDAADVYRKQQAIVTFESWKGKGHAVDTKSQKMRDWLINTGVLYEVPALLKSATRYEKSRKYGMAYVSYLAASQKSPTHQTCVDAGKKAEELADKAKAIMEQARTAMNEKKWTTATKTISDLSRQFTGSPFSDEVKTLRQELIQKRREAKTG
jgi:hypothetical protein